jgi:hypothetical protein
VNVFDRCSCQFGACNLLSGCGEAGHDSVTGGDVRLGRGLVWGCAPLGERFGSNWTCAVRSLASISRPQSDSHRAPIPLTRLQRHSASVGRRHFLEVSVNEGYDVGRLFLESTTTSGFDLVALRPTALDAGVMVDRILNADLIRENQCAD